MSPKPPADGKLITPASQISFLNRLKQLAFHTASLPQNVTSVAQESPTEAIKELGLVQDAHHHTSQDVWVYILYS